MWICSLNSNSIFLFYHIIFKKLEYPPKIIPVASYFMPKGISDGISNRCSSLKIPLLFAQLLRGKCINQKKLNVKTLPLVGTKWALQSYTPLKLQSGRAEVTAVRKFLITLYYWYRWHDWQNAWYLSWAVDRLSYVHIFILLWDQSKNQNNFFAQVANFESKCCMLFRKK